MVLSSHDTDEAHRRLEITEDNAREFLALHGGRDLKPMAVVHGHSLLQRISSAANLLDMGYRHLALGGIARLASSRKRAIAIVEAISRLKEQEPFWLHVLGISAASFWDAWEALDVDSFDGTGPFRPAFFGCYIGSDGTEYSVEKDGRKNSKKQPSVKNAPPCDCLACTTLKEHGISVRTFGSNEHNMGRAVHNVNMYLRTRRAWKPGAVTVQQGLL
jgi:tRNA-guanine family transglycosylase